MSDVEERLGTVEQQMARTTVRLDHIEHDVSEIGKGVKRLLDRDAARGESITWKSVAATCGALATIAVVVWWMIAHSPAVQALEKRVDRLDDPDIGRVTTLEKDRGWTATTVRAP